MNAEEVLEFIEENPVFFLATVKDDKPCVRGMMLYRADGLGIIFAAGVEKDLHHQLLENPAVELCFYRPLDNRQIRIGGAVEFLEDPGMKRDAWERIPFLKARRDAGGAPSIALYRLRHGVATVWSPESGSDSKDFITL
ncbi:MAG: pyridoxamine 5'-phosphate oxidase family protein [bacterium]|nr:pyridoxamine 5'-phosphate oxidase family protein [bacterium]